MPIFDLFTKRAAAARPRKGPDDRELVARKTGVPAGTPRVQKLPALPRPLIPANESASEQERMRRRGGDQSETMRIEQMARQGRVRYAPSSRPFQNTAEEADPENWFLSPDGSLLTFDPMYRRGRWRRGGELAKDPYRIGDVPGYEDTRAPWRQDHDQVIIREVMAFNQRHGYRPGDRRYLTPAYVKSVIINETGGEGSARAFRIDPMQIYVRGDWTDATSPRREAVMGVPRPQGNARLTPQQNIRGGIEWIDDRRALRGDNGRVSEILDDWHAAWRYNARSTPVLPNGRTFGQDYADRVMRSYNGMRKGFPQISIDRTRG